MNLGIIASGGALKPAGPELTWIQATTPAASSVVPSRVIYVPSTSTWVAFYGDATTVGGIIKKSTDNGETWTDATPAGSFNGFTWGYYDTDTSSYVTFSYTSSTLRKHVSTDLTTWTNTTMTVTTPSGATFIPRCVLKTPAGNWLATSYLSPNYSLLFYSTDFVTWSGVDIDPGKTDALNYIATDGTNVVVTGLNGRNYWSDDLAGDYATFTSIPSLPNSMNRVRFENSQFVANGTTRMATSTDGQTWIVNNFIGFSGNRQLNDILYVPTGDTFVGTGRSTPTSNTFSCSSSFLGKRWNEVVVDTAGVGGSVASNADRVVAIASSSKIFYTDVPAITP